MRPANSNSDSPHSPPLLPLETFAAAAATRKEILTFCRNEPLRVAVARIKTTSEGGRVAVAFSSHFVACSLSDDQTLSFSSVLRGK